VTMNRQASLQSLVWPEREEARVRQ
jgi:hypothetical protein